MIHIVKRRGHKEQFDERKLYASVYAACLVSHMKEKTCESVADFVTKKVKKDINDKKIVDSKTLAQLCIKYMKPNNEDAAFMYETHKDVS